MWVGDLKVRFAWLVEGVHLWTVDGWRSDGGGAASLLSGETDSKHTNGGVLSMSDSLKRSLVITSRETVDE